MIMLRCVVSKLVPWRARQRLTPPDPLLHPDLARLSQRELADLVIPPEEPAGRSIASKTKADDINET